MADQPPFLLSQLLAAHEKGFVDLECGNTLRQVISEVERVGRNGTLTLKFTVGPESDVGGVKIAIDTAYSLPKEPAAARLYFIDDDHRPTRRANQQPIVPASGDPVFPVAEARD